jgi:GNAT superfamily N-acetyltransferase
MPEGEQAQDLALAVRQRVLLRAPRRLRLSGDEAGAELRVDVAAALRDLANRRDDLGVGGLLEDVAARSGGERRADVLRVVLGLEQKLEAGAHDRVVVHDQDADALQAADARPLGYPVYADEDDLVAKVRKQARGSATRRLPVADDEQGRGIGTRLLEQLAMRAAEAGIESSSVEW